MGDESGILTLRMTNRAYRELARTLDAGLFHCASGERLRLILLRWGNEVELRTIAVPDKEDR